MVAHPSSEPAPEPLDLSTLTVAITEHAPLPMATLDGATHSVRYANPAFCRMMQKSAEQLVGQPFSQLLPEKDECLRLLERVARSGQPESYTEKDAAQPHPVFWSYTMWPVRADENLVGVMIQVTETAEFRGLTVAMNEALILGSVRQHELTEEAEGLNALLQLEIAAHKETAQDLAEKARLVDLSNDAIIVYDANSTITLWNKGAEKLYGWSYEEAVGKDFNSLLPTEFPIPLEDILGILQTEGQYTGEVVQIARDGRRVPTLCRWVLDRGTQSTLTTYTDISERAIFEREREALLANEQASRLEAEAANRAKDDFLATLSHEVRTPLNAILGWAAILSGGTPSAADLAEGMEVIERNCRAQAQLIEDVLDVSRIVSGKLELHLATAELTNIILAAISTVRPAADAKKILFETDLDNDASSIACDATRMQQVVWNLLINAIKFSPAGSFIRITVRRERSAIALQISDAGEGISPEFLPHVFDRFRQAEATSRRKHGGLGLGLSIVKHIVELHGGTVTATSPGKGRGATFTVNLPIRAIHEPSNATSLADNKRLPQVHVLRLDHLRILVVDDEADARRLIAKVLSLAGASVTTAPSAAAAMETLTHDHPQVLISDIGMPGQNGYDLIREVRAAGHTAKELPAIALTGFAHQDDRLRALLAGFQLHLTKPIDPHELIVVIASLTGVLHQMPPSSL